MQLDAAVGLASPVVVHVEGGLRRAEQQEAVRCDDPVHPAEDVALGLEVEVDEKIRPGNGA